MNGDHGGGGGGVGNGRPQEEATAAAAAVAIPRTSLPPSMTRPDGPAVVHTPPRPPSISTASHSTHPQTPPGSPMDIDFEGRSPSSSPATNRQLKKPVISVFDWDDTLCPSSWLFREGLLAGYGLVEDEDPIVTDPSSFGDTSDNSLPQDPVRRLPKKRLMESKDLHALRVFEDHVLTLLQTARHYGPVFIVTAAKLHWVRQCAEFFLPNVLRLLTKSDTLHVISAREFYADQSRRMASHESKVAAEGTPLAWKTVAFEAVCAHLRVEDYVRRSRSNTTSKSVAMAQAASAVDFVSVGDSLCERDACRFLAMKAPGMIHSKTLKFLDQPKLLELLEQVKMTRALYDKICGYNGCVDLHVTRSRGSLQVVQLDSTTATATNTHANTAASIAPTQHGPQETTANSNTRATAAELQRRAPVVACSAESLREELHEGPHASRDGIAVSGPRTSL